MLSWDPTKFGGIKTVHVSPELVWVPDIVLYNRFELYCYFSCLCSDYEIKYYDISIGRWKMN